MKFFLLVTFSLFLAHYQASASNKPEYHSLDNIVKDVSSHRMSKFVKGNSLNELRRLIGTEGTLKDFLIFSKEYEAAELTNVKSEIKGFQKKAQIGSCMNARKLIKLGEPQQAKDMQIAAYATKLKSELVPSLENFGEEYASFLKNCTDSAKSYSKYLSLPNNQPKGQPEAMPLAACPSGVNHSRLGDSAVLNQFIKDMNSAEEEVKKLSTSVDNGFKDLIATKKLSIGQGTKSRSYWRQVEKAGCDYSEASLAHKAGKFLKDNKKELLVGGAAVVGVGAYLKRSERKAKEKAKKKEEEKLAKIIDQCSQYRKVGSNECKQIFEKKCLEDSTEKGCSEYTTALCEGSTEGAAVGQHRPYCVLKNSQKFCETGSMSSPACQWMSQLPEECLQAPGGSQCFARFESPYILAAVCEGQVGDPLCKHIQTPHPDMKMIFYGPPTQPTGFAGTVGAAAAKAVTPAGANVFREISGSAASIANDVNSEQSFSALTQTASVTEDCFKKQLVECGFR